MEVFFNTPNFSDIDVILRDPTGKTQTIQAHRLVLIGNSEFFRGLLMGRFREAGQRDVTVEVPDLTVAVELLKWMYTKDPFFPPATRELAHQWLVPGAIIQEKVTYPGIPGQFVHSEGSWDRNLAIRGSTIKKMITFQSVTPDSLITELILQQTDEGRLRVGIGFLDIILFELRNPPDQVEARKTLSRQFKEYLNQYQLRPDFCELHSGRFYAETAPRSRTLLQLVLRNNTFSKEDRKFLEKIMSTSVSPTSDEPEQR